MHLRLNQRGDTIVEVLIAIGIISLILGGAFVLTNRSLQGTRVAQERLNGTKLVESQLEQLKNLANTNSDAIFGGSVPASFCVTSAGAVVGSGNAACKVGIDGMPTTQQPQFNLSVTRNASANTFTVRCVWDSIRQGQDKVEMVYKLYED